MTDFIKPFGPWIMVDRISDDLLARLNARADRVLSNEVLSAQFDWSHQLAGNVHNEVLVTFADEAERDLAFAELKTKVLHYVDRLAADESIPKRGAVTPDGVRFDGMWFVNQRAGDFNPAHKHGGDLSAVVYLRLPEGIEREWQAEDHYPSAGIIEFIDGRPNRFARTGHRVRPQPGMLLLFPAWLLHTVYPFRCPGERRSMSFNVTLPQLADA